MPRPRGLVPVLAAALFFVGAALAALASPALAQVPMDLVALPGKPAPDGYNPADPRFSSSQLCDDLGGDTTVQGGGEVCKGMDKSGTFCIVGSRDAFPCRGLYKHVINCNGGHNRPALNPFICARKCDENTERARGANCEIAVHPDAVVAATLQSVNHWFESEFDGFVHTIVVLRHTLAFSENLEADEFTLSADGDDWIIEVPPPLAQSTLIIALTADIKCENCYPQKITLSVNIRRVDFVCGEIRDEIDGQNIICIEYLIDSGEDIYGEIVEGGATPLHYATELNYPEVVSALIRKGADVERGTRWGGNTPLHYAAEHDSYEAAVVLLENGARATVNNPVEIAPLHLAAENNASVMASLLIANGADVNEKDLLSWTPLYLAAEYNALEVASLLLENGANVNVVREYYGDTPLHSAAYNDYPKMVSLLIKKGANVNAANNQGGTPLHYAAYINALESAAILLANGADVNASGYHDATPLDDAIDEGNTDMQTLLRQHGGMCNNNC